MNKENNKNKIKIGIITLHGYFNYGNRLQIYATEQVLMSLGFNVETIINHNATNKDTNTTNNILKKIYRIAKKNPKKIIKKTKDKLWKLNKKNEIEKAKKLKTIKFKNFSKQYLHESNYILSLNNIPDDINSKYDYFITGSDQVWNPTLQSSSALHFLIFAQENKRIAYTPSFGIINIPDNYISKYKLWLSKMNSLSVREEAGAKIINELTGRKAKVLIDPTMMLTRKVWLKLSKKPSIKYTGDYILTYILGNLPNSKKKKINLFAKNNNLKIINLADMNNLNYYTTGPREFLDLINSAKIVFTDSFHASVFSILFRKPFVVYDRHDDNLSMNSRIETLLNKFDLMYRYKLSPESDKIFKVDYSQIPALLKKEREKTYNYLRQALNID
ncbi:MAG: polysaccharide pyruvyl transferase family protein [Candidatus Woesearchaeota archaeon]